MTKLGPRRTAGRWAGIAAIACVVLASCAQQNLPPSEFTLSDTLATTSVPAAERVAIVVDGTASALPFDRRLLGTNVPAWIGPERLADPEFVTATVESGVSLLRMPGGSWSNSYDWFACEVRDESGCFFAGAARPTDFIDFMQATGVDGSWTVSINRTAQHAAAAVAFFNGDVDDQTIIGVDRNGFDWGTVGFWASVRADGGNPEPVGIELWEVGNEVYGGKPEAGGDQCADFGWEDVWTCDGTEYVLGDESHDGYLAIREAMRAVDSDITVGAVGVSDPSSWSDWGDEVISAAGDQLDFYIVHEYGFDSSPAAETALARPSSMWPGTISAVRASLGDSIPIAVTEYNLVAFEGGDAERTMTQNMNALFIADTIGQLAELGVSVANQWNLANGTTASGTDYGMIRLEDGSTTPQYDAMRLWSGAGSELLEAVSSDEMVHAYPTRHEDGSVTLLIVNLNESVTDVTIELEGLSLGRAAQVTGVSTGDLGGSTMTVLDETSAEMIDGSLSADLPGWSIVSIEVPSDD